MTLAERWVSYPQQAQPLPTPSDLARIAGLPLAQMFVVGRSGSGLVHAFLDSHAEILHVPHTFKFYDFVATNPNLCAATPRAIAERFYDSPLVPFLFDSSRSVIIGGRLGPRMKTFVRIDRERFCGAFLSAVGTLPMTWRRLFTALVLAYGWAVGQDLKRIRLVFHHVHHGDWLWPERLIDRSNYHTALPAPPSEILRADMFVISLREPHDAWMAYRRFIDGQGMPDPARLNAQEQFLRLLMQDWERLHHITSSGARVHVVRIEDLRVSALSAMQSCAQFLGIDPTDPALAALTYFGFEWFGDIYTPASSTVHPPSASAGQLDWQEAWLADSVFADLAAQHGYQHRSAVAIKSALLSLTVAHPHASLFDTRGPGGMKAQLQAARRASQRVAFAREMQRRIAA